MTSYVVTPPAVEAVLRKACYDCHSSETRWPWYSKIAPVSWLVAGHVQHGRGNLDFSVWSTDPVVEPTEAQRLNAICREMRNDLMPPRDYRLLHPEARLTASDTELICAWTANALAVIATVATSGAAARFQVDRDWLRLWTDAQSRKPPTLTSVSRIAPVDEPGTPLVLHGRIFAPDGTRPVAGAIVFAYQTDRNGLYDLTGRPGQPWRLTGWAVTNDAGGFELTTIRPAPSPGLQIPAHVHLTVETPQYGRQWTDEMRFADDPFVQDAERRTSASLGPFGAIKVVRTLDGVEHVDVHVRLKPKGDF
jgi:hypothetical protein